jgi:hypothetical protein
VLIASISLVACSTTDEEEAADAPASQDGDNPLDPGPD